MTAIPLRRGLPIVALGGVTLVVVTLGAPFVGSTGLHLARVFTHSVPFADNVDAQIFFLARLPRALAAALVGCALAAAGVVFQGLLRNPLATPYTLGVSAGAALGAMIAITFGSIWPVGGVATASLAGALLAVFVVYALASARHRGLSTTVLLLAGVTLNAFFSALILFVQYLSNFADTYRALRWLMGDLDVASYLPILAALPFVVVAFLAFAWLARPLNLLSLGAEAAGTRGVNVVPRAAGRVLQRVDCDRRGGVCWRTDRLCRHHRAASRAPGRRRRSPAGAAGVGTLWRSVSRAVRRGGADRIRAARAAGRHRHSAHRRAVLSVAAPEATMTRRAWIRSGLVAVLGWALASGAGTARVDARGQSSTASGAPRRIVSLVPAVTEMLFALGAGDFVIGVSSFDHYPPAVESRTRVGALVDPDFERILSLKPDLVIVYSTQNDLVARLGRANLPVFNYEHAGLADITDTIRKLGDRIGRSSEARREAERIERGLDDFRRRAVGQPRPVTALIFERDAGSLRGMFASGGIGFLHDMLEVAGGTDAFADVQRQSLQLSVETLLARAPEVILELRPDEGWSADRLARERDVWKTLSSVPAIRTGRFYILADQRVLVPGPRVVEGVGQMFAALHRGR